MSNLSVKKREKMRIKLFLGFVTLGLTFVTPNILNATSRIPAVVINEIYYDSPGTDEHTFTELKGEANASLDSFYLIGVNGANGRRYRTIALSGCIIPADSYFVVAQDTGVANFDTIANVNWQNGPDNVVLIYVSGNDTSIVDAVGYGNFTGADSFFVGEGSSAPDVPPGQSIGRYPDGQDTNDNSADFFKCNPTPGVPNEAVGVEEKIMEVPATLKLYQNRPNPHSGRTEIFYQLSTTCRVRLTIYDLLGKVVRRLVDKVEHPGYKGVIWNGEDKLGDRVASGIYFYRLVVQPIRSGEAKSYIAQKMMIVLR